MNYKDYISYYDIDASTFSWFCGLFEAEGSISFAAPTEPKNQVNIKISMMDKDIIERASLITKTGLLSYRQSGYDYDMYRVHLGGIRAVEILKLMLPYLSLRRKNRAKEIINSFNYKFILPLKKNIVVEIENKLRDGYKGIEIAKMYKIGNSVVSQIKHGKHYIQMGREDYTIPIPKINGRFNRISWLAGLLEGDGTFIKRKEKSMHHIALNMKDKDTVERAAKILKSNVGYLESRNMYYTTKAGSKAIKIMKVILPLMGERRALKIREII